MRRRVVTPLLVVALDVDLAEPFSIGQGNVFLLRGRCYHPTRTIRWLTLLCDGRSLPISNHSRVRADVAAAVAQGDGDCPNSLTSGFWVSIPLASISVERRVPVVLRAVFTDGSSSEATAGVLHLVPGSRRPKTTAEPARPPLVAICLATCEPDPVFFRAQVESLIQQTYAHWVCVVSDDCSSPERFAEIMAITACDARFTVTRNPIRLGYYRNFESALTRVPPDATFVALSDHDDVWYPHKLAAALATFRPEMGLVYSDMDVVTRDGQVISRTYWTTRRNNYTDLSALVFANTVTGAATIFRASLLDALLPFPIPVGEAYHDHWIACAALTAGAIGYVDAPTYAYRQHASNVLGHYAPPPHRLFPRPAEVVRALGPSGMTKRMMAALWRLRAIYDHDVIRLVLIVRVLLVRLEDRTTPAKRAILLRLAGLERSWFGLVHEALLAALTRRPTLGAERYCLKGAFAAWLLDHYYRRHRDRVYAARRLRARDGTSP